MSHKTTTKMIEAVRQVATPTMFLSGMFQAPRRNFFNSQTVQFDIVRGNRSIAPVITNMAAGGHINSADQFTNKEFTPPVFKEVGHINGFDMINRMPGDTPFTDPRFQAAGISKATELIRINSDKIKRTNELQAAQILQTGTLTLKDEKNVDAFSIDFKPKSSHFFNAATAWATVASATPLLDLETACDVIQTDGMATADTAIFGADAWNNFIRNADVQALLDNRRMILGGIAPREMGPGAKFMGTMSVGSYTLELWTYIGLYDDLAGNIGVKYVDDAKVIVRASSGRMDALFGSIPQIVKPSVRVLPFMPRSIRSSTMQMGMSLNAWSDDQGENVFVQVAARPLLVPSQIDTFACITTT